MNLGRSKWKNKSLLKRRTATTKILFFVQNKSTLLGCWKKLSSCCNADHPRGLEQRDRWSSFPAQHSSCGGRLELMQRVWCPLAWCSSWREWYCETPKPQENKRKLLAKQHSTKQQQRKVVAKFTVEKFWITKCSFLVSSQRSAPCQPLDSQKTTAEELHTHLLLVFKGISHSSFCEPSVKHTSLVSWVAES